MCLLEYNNDGELSLTKDFVGGEIPEYAPEQYHYNSLFPVHVVQAVHISLDTFSCLVLYLGAWKRSRA